MQTVENWLALVCLKKGNPPTEEICDDVHDPVSSENLFGRERIAEAFLRGPVHRHISTTPKGIQETGRYHGARCEPSHGIESLSQPRHRVGQESVVERQDGQLWQVDACIVEVVACKGDLVGCM
jgi:hypothetical protein